MSTLPRIPNLQMCILRMLTRELAVSVPVLARVGYWERKQAPNQLQKYINLVLPSLYHLRGYTPFKTLPPPKTVLAMMHYLSENGLGGFAGSLPSGSLYASPTTSSSDGRQDKFWESPSRAERWEGQRCCHSCWYCRQNRLTLENAAKGEDGEKRRRRQPPSLTCHSRYRRHWGNIVTSRQADFGPLPSLPGFVTRRAFVAGCPNLIWQLSGLRYIAF